MSTSAPNLSSILSSVNDAFSGKTSGIDVQTVVGELMAIQRQPETQMQAEQTTINNQISLLGTISNDLQGAIHRCQQPAGRCRRSRRQDGHFEPEQHCDRNCGHLSRDWKSHYHGDQSGDRVVKLL